MDDVPEPAMLTSEQLWAEVLSYGAFDSANDRASAVVDLLQRRGESQTADWALAALRSTGAWHREAATWVLGSLSVPDRSVIMAALITAAEEERDADTFFNLVDAIGHAQDARWLNDLLRYADHTDPQVRESVARHLPNMDSADTRTLPAEAIEALIILTRDAEPRVRDWATMGLGFQTANGNGDAAIREALHARLDDEDYDDDDGYPIATSGEALLALAYLHDPTIAEHLAARLAEPTHIIGNLPVEAAGAYGDPRYLPALYRLREAGWADDPDEAQPETLADAITALEALQAK